MFCGEDGQEGESQKKGPGVQGSGRRDSELRVKATMLMTMVCVGRGSRACAPHTDINSHMVARWDLLREARRTRGQERLLVWRTTTQGGDQP